MTFGRIAPGELCWPFSLVLTFQGKSFAGSQHPTDMVIGDQLSEGDLRELAHLHVATLDLSLVTRLGLKYAIHFYRYIARSEHDIIVIRRDPSTGTVCSACVTSLKPDSLERRLLFGTPLIVFGLLTISPTSWYRLLFSSSRPPSPQVSDQELLNVARSSPELILMFSHSSRQSQGLGAQLITATEAALRELHVSMYHVKTLDADINRALQFYTRCGFHKLERINKYGLSFQVFYKHVAALPA